MINIIQTFYIDPSAVAQSSEVYITDVELYVKLKPNSNKNSSGILNPGIVLSICEVANETPNLDIIYPQRARLGFNNISALADASVSTVFSFDKPIKVKTDRYYGIMIAFEDSNYQLWTNKIGDRLLGTNTPSVGSTSSRNGSYFQGSSDAALKGSNDVTLKFKVNVAKFDTSPINAVFVNKDYEFFTYNTRSGVFIGGEPVFGVTSLRTGTASVVGGNTTVKGTGTTFSSLVIGQGVVFTSGNTTALGYVRYVVNDTALELVDPISLTNAVATFQDGLTGTVNVINYIDQKITLSKSTANVAIKFIPGMVVTGVLSGATANIASVDNLLVDQFTSHVNTATQIAASMSPTYGMAYSNGSNYVFDTTFIPLASDQLVSTSSPQKVILSKSNEVVEPYLYANTKSYAVNLAIGTSNPFAAPVIDTSETDLTVRHNLISNTYIDQFGFDTEVGLSGIALTKHFTTKMTFDQGQLAEDLKVYCTAYRPLGTNIRVYARFYNSSDSEAFDDKSWTPLAVTANTGLYSSKTNASDFIEYEYSVPNAPPSSTTLAGTFITVNGSATVTGTVAGVVIGNVVKIYSPLFPSNYSIGIVAGVTTTQITLATPITDPNVVGSGFKVDVLKYPNVAFTYQNLKYANELCYFNAAGAFFNNYSAVQVKIVLLADNTNVVPSVAQIQVIAVSA